MYDPHDLRFVMTKSDTFTVKLKVVGRLAVSKFSELLHVAVL